MKEVGNHGGCSRFAMCAGYCNRGEWRGDLPEYFGPFPDRNASFRKVPVFSMLFWNGRGPDNQVDILRDTGGVLFEMQLHPLADQLVC